MGIKSWLLDKAGYVPPGEFYTDEFVSEFDAWRRGERDIPDDWDTVRIEDSQYEIRATEETVEPPLDIGPLSAFKAPGVEIRKMGGGDARQVTFHALDESSEMLVNSAVHKYHIDHRA